MYRPLAPHLLLGIALAVMMAACSTPDKEAYRDANQHPHPFEMRATDSSIIATYMWKDTCDDYFLAVTMDDADGGTKFITPSKEIVFPPVSSGKEAEFLFRDLRMSDPQVTYGIWFLSDKHKGDEYGFKWLFTDGAFEPVRFQATPKGNR